MAQRVRYWRESALPIPRVILTALAACGVPLAGLSRQEGPAVGGGDSFWMLFFPCQRFLILCFVSKYKPVAILYHCVIRLL